MLALDPHENGGSMRNTGMCNGKQRFRQDPRCPCERMVACHNSSIAGRFGNSEKSDPTLRTATVSTCGRARC
jgi:hypothetical protein